MLYSILGGGGLLQLLRHHILGGIGDFILTVCNISEFEKIERY